MDRSHHDGCDATLLIDVRDLVPPTVAPTVHVPDPGSELRVPPEAKPRLEQPDPALLPVDVANERCAKPHPKVGAHDGKLG